MSATESRAFIAPASAINGAITADTPPGVVEAEWTEVKLMLEEPPPSCTHPAVLRRWQLLKDAGCAAAIAYVRPQWRWTRMMTNKYIADLEAQGGLGPIWRDLEHNAWLRAAIKKQGRRKNRVLLRRMWNYAWTIAQRERDMYSNMGFRRNPLQDLRDDDIMVAVVINNKTYVLEALCKRTYVRRFPKRPPLEVD